MSVPPSSPSPPLPSSPPDGVGDAPPPTVDDRLLLLVEALDQLHLDRPGGLIVKVSGLVTETGEVEASAVPAHEVYHHLLGTTFAPRCDAVGVVVPGRARSLGDAHHRGGEVLGRAVVAFAVARDGASASSLRIDDGDPVVVAGGAEPCAGRMADVVRRGFGLPTAAPEVPIGSLARPVLLHRVHARALDAETITVALVDSWRPALPGSWSQLRHQCVEGRWPELGVHPELAEWMDDGIFSRTCAQAFPDPLEVMIELGELLDRSVWLRLVEHLAACDG